MALFSKKSSSISEEREVGLEVKSRPKYGIDEAIQLMRTLPVDQHPDLVVLVIKNTLASINVNVKDTIRDAVGKQETVGQQIAKLKAEIAGLEEKIHSHKQRVTILEAELAEIIRVRARLEAVVGPDEPSIVPPVPQALSARPPSTSSPRPPTARPRPPASPPSQEAGRDTIELPDSALEVDTGAKTRSTES